MIYWAGERGGERDYLCCSAMTTAAPNHAGNEQSQLAVSPCPSSTLYCMDTVAPTYDHTCVRSHLTHQTKTRAFMCRFGFQIGLDAAG